MKNNSFFLVIQRNLCSIIWSVKRRSVNKKETPCLCVMNQYQYIIGATFDSYDGCRLLWINQCKKQSKWA